jgi:hypothetical protein
MYSANSLPGISSYLLSGRGRLTKSCTEVVKEPVKGREEEAGLRGTASADSDNREDLEPELVHLCGRDGCREAVAPEDTKEC